MEMKKNDKFVLKIEDMGEDGAGIGKLDGYIWFVKDALIGDVAEVSVMKQKKNYGFARLVRILEPAPGRVEARCPVARQCGGCQLQELSYGEQLKFKERKVWNHLRRIGGLERLFLPGQEEEAAKVPGAVVMEPIVGMEDPWRYRNKAQYPIGRDRNGELTAGFYAGRTHSLIPIPHQDCLLGCEENRLLLKAILEFMKEFGIRPYEEESHSGLVRHALLRKGFASGQLMVCLVINGDSLPHGDVLARRLEALGVQSVSLSVNKEKTNVIMGSRIISLLGPGYITDSIGDVEYRISPLSFYQVNPVQTEKLYGTALEFAGLTGRETVWDLYCGIGTISSFLARKAKKVYGVEIIPQAIEDARKNAERNGLDNVEFYVGKAEEVLPEQYEKHHIRADVIVVDPPRKGCDSVCLDTIIRMAPEKVVYVSCDSSTLARDVKYLEENGYETRRVRTVDMFGMTGHVETVCLLSNRKPDSYVHLNLKMEDYYRIKDAQKEQDKK